jgi:hypothetical protein
MPISSHNALHGRNALILSKKMGPILSNIPQFFANRGRKKKPISFGGIPNSRSVLFLEIFLKRAAKPSAGNTSAGLP